MRTINSPQLLDVAAMELKDKLSAIDWLTTFYGIAERRSRSKGRNNILSRPLYDDNYPAVYKGDNDYVDLFPDDSKGNFAYLDIDEDQNITYRSGTIASVKATGKIVFWWDFRKCYDDHESRSVEHVKHDIIAALNTNYKVLRNFDVTGLTTKVQDVYKGYNHKEINNQFAMRPYGAIAVNISFQVDQGCAYKTMTNA